MMNPSPSVRANFNRIVMPPLYPVPMIRKGQPFPAAHSRQSLASFRTRLRSTCEAQSGPW